MHLNIFEHFKTKVKSSYSYGKKKYALFWTTFFFLSIVEAGGSAFTAVRIGSYLIKILRKIN